MRRAWTFARAVVSAFRRHQDTRVASSLAYQVLFAIVPLTGVLLAAFGFVMRDPGKQRAMVEHVLEVLPLQSNTFITDAVRSIASQRAALSIIGIVGVVWSASGLFGAVRDALNDTWEAEKPRGFVKDKLVDIGAMLGIGLLLVGSILGTLLIHLLGTLTTSDPSNEAFRALVPLLTFFGLAFPALFSFCTFLLLYRYVPNVKHCARDVWVGAAVATVLFELGKHIFTFYVARVSPRNVAYGALGDVMLFMLWMWVSANILLIGAEVAAETSRLVCRDAAEPETPPAQTAPKRRPRRKAPSTA